MSGVKKNGQDRHWAGSGKITIDNQVVAEYLEVTGQQALDERRFVRADIPCQYPIKRIRELENQKVQ